MIRKTLEFYFSNNTPIHLTLNTNIWLNGLIKKISKDNFVLNEEKFGDMIIIFDNIKPNGIMPRGKKR